ncbi:hypothetical protein [Blastococcus brunescens]|uniref:Uncharacterized protein n=1 Tax=Blastococcus brunescens TaxID=1564165 RepID=A0ABZ1B671_9ACTN|nr:hypothetical protein [Blastococcus sp. BMG 8361]WRL65328.1 hypothetical protein U6N30_06660 [Blastococcus sp. BMG 8361]
MASSRDEDDWARARAVLDRLPPEPADKRRRRLRLQRRLVVLAVLVAGFSVVTVLLLAVVDLASLRAHADPPPWRIAAGIAMQVVGLVGMISVLVVHSGAVRHTRGWSRPLHWLTRQEHKGLLRQARGQEPLTPEDLALVRHAALLQLVRPAPLASPSALLLLFVGQYTAAPDTVRLVLVLGMAACVVAAVVHVRKDTRRLRRFLDEHPASHDSAA